MKGKGKGGWKLVCRGRLSVWVVAAVAFIGIMAGNDVLAASSSSGAEQASTPSLPAKAQRHQATLERAHDWLDHGQGKAAYDLLQPLLPELSGLVVYDTLFGHAAIQADEPSQAAFAFERCLASQPENGTCRLGMARAHMDLQEVASARQELNALSSAGAPEHVQEVIEDYVNRLSGVEAVNTDTRLTSYIEVGAGYDSNINNATSRSSMALPLFNGLEFKLSPEGRQSESGFASAKYHLRYSTPIATNWRFLAQGNVAATGNWATHRYDTVVSDAEVGLARQNGPHQLVMKLQGQNYRLHERDYRNVAGVLGQYTYSASDRSQLTVFGQASRLYYPRNSLRNTNRYTLGATWMHGLANDRAVTFLSAHGGQEKTVKSHAPRQYGHHFTGARAGGMVLLTPRMQLEAGAGAERRRYGGRDLLFLKGRRDTHYDAYAGLSYAINRKLSIRPRYRYVRNRSNIALYDYSRHVVSLNLRYELF